MFINCNGTLVNVQPPLVMGIINLTPDSFFSSSRAENDNQILHSCEKMLAAGATFIDIGGYSTRPGASHISEEEELSRVIHGVKTIKKSFKDVILSVDTFRSEVARIAVENGVAMVNDISAGDDDPLMMKTIAKLQVPYIMMHKRGTPKNMNSFTSYGDVTQEVLDYLIEKINTCTKIHIHDTVVDPGFGFAKTLDQNYTLLQNLDVLKILKKPVLVGISRKKMIQEVIQSDAGNALNGTTVANTIALLKGANILRVHDVKEAIECIKIVRQINK